MPAPPPAKIAEDSDDDDNNHDHDDGHDEDDDKVQDAPGEYLLRHLEAALRATDLIGHVTRVHSCYVQMFIITWDHEKEYLPMLSLIFLSLMIDFKLSGLFWPSKVMLSFSHKKFTVWNENKVKRC